MSTVLVPEAYVCLRFEKGCGKFFIAFTSCGLNNKRRFIAPNGARATHRPVAMGGSIVTKGNRVSCVLIFTDEPVLGEAARSFAGGVSGVGPVFVCGSINDLIESLRQQSPDLLLADWKPGLTLDVLAGIRNSAPHCKIVLWSYSVSAEAAFQATTVGVRGILRRTCSVELMSKCLRKVLDGELWFEKALTDSFLSMETVSLSRREAQLVTLLSQGLRNKEIAAVLDIAEKTVKVYLTHLFRKLGVKDRFELALFGLKNLVSLDQNAPQCRTIQVPRLRPMPADRPERAFSAAAAPHQWS